MQPRRVNFHTLGCKLNFSESSTLAREFERGGFVRVAPTAEADICVINSCSVTEHADKKCRNLIRKLHRRNPAAIIAVTGCYAQLKPQEIAAIEGVDIVLSNNDKGTLFKRVVELSGKGRAQVYSCETDSLTSFFAAFSSGDRTRAFLKVQDGCDYCCSYCTIHYARGASRNLPIADLVAEAIPVLVIGIVCLLATAAPLFIAMPMPKKPVIAPASFEAAAFIACACAPTRVAAAMVGSRMIAVRCACFIISASSSGSVTEPSAMLTILSPRSSPHLAVSVSFIAFSRSVLCVTI